jgi:hypothetical protein
MAKGFQSWDEVTGHLHPVHRPPGGYPLTGLAVEYDLAS